MKKLIILSGVPGSGKSYFSTQYQKAKGSHVYIVSSDALRQLINGDQSDMSSDRLMWRMFYKMAYIYSIDPQATVILDATHSTSYYRIEATTGLKDRFDEIDLVSFNIPSDVVLHQHLDREHPIPQDELLKLFDKFEAPGKADSDYFDKIFIIDKHDIEYVINNL